MTLSTIKVIKNSLLSSIQANPDTLQEVHLKVALHELSKVDVTEYYVFCKTETNPSNYLYKGSKEFCLGCLAILGKEKFIVRDCDGDDACSIKWLKQKYHGRDCFQVGRKVSLFDERIAVITKYPVTGMKLETSLGIFDFGQIYYVEEA